MSKKKVKQNRFGKIFRGHPYVVPVVTFLGLFVICLVAFVGFNAQIDLPDDAHIIEFSIAGNRESIPSRAKTVGEFLERAEVELGHNDIVEPSAETEITDEKFHINVYRARPVTVVEGGQRSFAYSAATTPRSVAKQAGVKLYPEDKVVATVPDSFLREGILGEKVIIDRSTPANINLYGEHVPVRTHAQTVRDLLDEKNINIKDEKEVKPALNTPIKAGIQIFVVKPGTKLATVHEEIEMPVETVDDPKLSFGVRVVRQEGSPGKKVVTYQIIVDKNGKETGRKKIQEVVSVAPVKQVVARGQAVYIVGNHAAIMTAAGIPASEQAAADAIIYKESGWRTGAMNAGGCAGLGQACPGSKLAAVCPNWQTDPVCQMRFFSGYAQGRYGSWNAAHEAWMSKGWW